MSSRHMVNLPPYYGRIIRAKAESSGESISRIIGRAVKNQVDAMSTDEKRRLIESSDGKKRNSY